MAMAKREKTHYALIRLFIIIKIDVKMWLRGCVGVCSFYRYLPMKKDLITFACNIPERNIFELDYSSIWCRFGALSLLLLVCFPDIREHLFHFSRSLFTFTI